MGDIDTILLRAPEMGLMIVSAAAPLPTVVSDADMNVFPRKVPCSFHRTAGTFIARDGAKRASAAICGIGPRDGPLWTVFHAVAASFGQTIMIFRGRNSLGQHVVVAEEKVVKFLPEPRPAAGQLLRILADHLSPGSHFIAERE